MNDYERILSDYLAQDIKQYEKELNEAFKSCSAIGLTPDEMTAFLLKKYRNASN